MSVSIPLESVHISGYMLTFPVRALVRCDLFSVLDRTDYSIRLLFHLTASEKAPKTIQQHLQERPFYRDAFVSGIGRLAYHEIPEWLADEHLMQRLDMIGGA